MTAWTGRAPGGDGNVYVRFVNDDSWDETALTNAEPAAEDESLGRWFLWYDTNQIAAKKGTLQNEALRRVVQEEADGDNFLSLRLNSPSYRTNYRPREWSDADQRPQLVLTYSTVP